MQLASFTLRLKQIVSNGNQALGWGYSKTCVKPPLSKRPIQYLLCHFMYETIYQNEKGFI